jgi:polysaccharide biosynthesis transport protein
MLLSIDSGGALDFRRGFTDLVAGEVSFADIIGRDTRSRLHLVGSGLADDALLTEEPGVVDVALQAFDQTYDWVICLLHDSANAALLGLVAPRVDTLVIASNEDAASPPLVELYERAKAAGAPDVVVAREAEPAEADLVAA